MALSQASAGGDDNIRARRVNDCVEYGLPCCEHLELIERRRTVVAGRSVFQRAWH
jgi:hypothetical protein